MSNFDVKFGPEPVEYDPRVVVAQVVAVLVASIILRPAFLNTPETSELSILLAVLFACVIAGATVHAHRSFTTARAKW